MDHLPTISRWEVFKNRKRILKNPLPFHRENFDAFGDSFRVDIGRATGVVFTRDPVIIKHILQKQHKRYEKSTLQTVDLAKYIGHGILTSNGEYWRTHRRMVQPAFHKKKLQGLILTMKGAIGDEIARIPSGSVVDIAPLLGDMAFQVVAKSLFSRADIRKRMEQLQHITQRNQQMLIREMRQPYFKWWFHLSGKIGRHLGYSEQGRTILGRIISERINSGEDRDDLLDMLLRARYEDGTPMSREELIDEVMVLFTAGHETTANALGFTLFLLAKHPTLQEKAYLEVSQNSFNEQEPIESLAKMPYIHQCIEEALRLYPPAYVIDRVALEADAVNGILFPKDALVLMSVYELHRHAAFWDSPEEFRPERFGTDRKKDITNYYYPFGAGPRMCVGNNFAMYEMVLAVSDILLKYGIEPGRESIELNPLISLKPREVPLRFIQR